jgi:hypothetical protein
VVLFYFANFVGGGFEGRAVAGRLRGPLAVGPGQWAGGKAHKRRDM